MNFSMLSHDIMEKIWEEKVKIENLIKAGKSAKKQYPRVLNELRGVQYIELEGELAPHMNALYDEYYFFPSDEDEGEVGMDYEDWKVDFFQTRRPHIDWKSPDIDEEEEEECFTYLRSLDPKLIIENIVKERLRLKQMISRDKARYWNLPLYNLVNEIRSRGYQNQAFYMKFDLRPTIIYGYGGNMGMKSYQELYELQKEGELKRAIRRTN